MRFCLDHTIYGAADEEEDIQLPCRRFSAVACWEHFEVTNNLRSVKLLQSHQAKSSTMRCSKLHTAMLLNLFSNKKECQKIPTICCLLRDRHDISQSFVYFKVIFIQNIMFIHSWPFVIYVSKTENHGNKINAWMKLLFVFQTWCTCFAIACS